MSKSFALLGLFIGFLFGIVCYNIYLSRNDWCYGIYFDHNDVSHHVYCKSLAELILNEQLQEIDILKEKLKKQSQ